MADISDIKASDREIDIVHPANKEPLGITVRLVSIDDDRLKRAKRAILDRRLHLEARGKHFKADEVEENANNILFNAVLGWNWEAPTEGANKGEQPSFKGEIPDFNRKNFITVVTELTWFRDQINEAIGETEAFFGNSKSN